MLRRSPRVRAPKQPRTQAPASYQSYIDPNMSGVGYPRTESEPRYTSRPSFPESPRFRLRPLIPTHPHESALSLPWSTLQRPTNPHRSRGLLAAECLGRPWSAVATYNLVR